MFSPVFSGKLNTNEIYGKQSFSNCELDVLDVGGLVDTTNVAT